MKHALQHLVARLALAGVLAASAGAQPRPSLFITEVMTKTTMNQYPAFRGTDFWELYNPGSNAINLTGYSFRDEDKKVRIFVALSNLIIHPDEAVVFVNTKPSDISTCATNNQYQFITNAAFFIQWWGATNLPANLQVCPYSGGRFNGLGDRLCLYDPAGRIVDSVELDVATPGRSFCYDPAAGAFEKVSSGEAGVFKAARTDDYGSPGRVPGPTPLRILQQPTSQSVNVEMDATLTVGTGGMPPPSYQWTFDGRPLTNGTAASLTISNVQPTDAGDYQVYVGNDSTQLVSAVATLTVTTNPYVKILRSPMNLTVYEGQPALFWVSAKGVPAPQYQWQANGVDLAGETDSLLAVPFCSPEMSGTVYSVRVWNQGCATNASARLIVSSRPRLAITELMSLTSFGHADWFELTNYGTNALDLLGYRFYDREPSNGLFYASLDGSSEVVTITRSLVIKPRESVIFVHHLSADDFIRWWGQDNLPPGLQIYTYSGFALSICGESLFLWNAAAVETSDVVATTMWSETVRPVSWESENTFYELYGYYGSCESNSVLGIHGAWAAPAGSDIGSPGLTEVTPPHFLSISRDPGEITVKCRGNAGRSYRLSRKTYLADSQWVPVTDRAATNALPFYLRDSIAAGSPMRFYRLEELP